MASRQTMLPSFLLLAFLGLLVAAPLASAQDGDIPGAQAVTQTGGTEPTGPGVNSGTAKADGSPALTKQDSSITEYNTDYSYYPPYGYYITDVYFLKYNKKYTKAYFKVKISNGKKTKTKTIYVPAPYGAVFTYVDYFWNYSYIYFETYYVYLY